MVIGILGESCTGKSILADKLARLLPAEVYTGNDFLRLAKNASIARTLFQKKLGAAASGSHVIYVISEKEQLSLLPEKAIRILATAELDTIKERFARRVCGSLPAPVAAMLKQKHGCFDQEAYDIRVVSGVDDLDAACKAIQQMVAGN